MNGNDANFDAGDLGGYSTGYTPPDFSAGTAASETASDNIYPAIQNAVNKVVTALGDVTQQRIYQQINKPPGSFVTNNPPAETKPNQNSALGPYQANAPQSKAPTIGQMISQVPTWTWWLAGGLIAAVLLGLFGRRG